eukprot:TRINITY_DN9_c0_g1_i1.p1 TRINITY_DN9_c0_g1~~TRINITY_DN9_c0_g1_i1.p1  ORF type:complete len:326 (-),score=75.47 TRINITY_DN9_c0_g1_i1:27-1004(-)
MSQVVLVTGGSGLVGQAIRAVVEEDPETYGGYEFYYSNSSEANLVDYESTAALFERVNPTFVIHLAARVGGLYRNMNEGTRMFEDNLAINKNVVECCDKFGVKNSVHCLSTCIFPDKVEYPISEDKLHEGAPHFSNAGYAYAKRMLDVHTSLYNKEYQKKGEDRSMICVIPTNVYGPHDNFNLEDSHVIPGLMHKAFISQRDNSQYVIYGSGTPLRQFIHSYDLAKLMLWTMFEYSKSSWETIILSPDPESEVSIKDVALSVASAMGVAEENIVFDTSKADGQFKKTADNSRLRTFHPDYEFIQMDEGIKQTAEWFKANYETLRK